MDGGHGKRPPPCHAGSHGVTTTDLHSLGCKTRSTHSQPPGIWRRCMDSPWRAAGRHFLLQLRDSRAHSFVSSVSRLSSVCCFKHLMGILERELSLENWERKKRNENSTVLLRWKSCFLILRLWSSYCIRPENYDHLISFFSYQLKDLKITAPSFLRDFLAKADHSRQC